MKISRLPKEALVLDAGGGARQLGGEKYINFEYMYRDDYPDIFGDGHYLPFKDNSFDFIISQGVLEHTYNPFQISGELYRVLKPGGKIYVDTAFIQPYHGVPHHYFNFTMSGLKEVFKNFNELSVNSWGAIHDALKWYYDDIGMSDKIGEGKYNEILGEIKYLDSVITEEERKKFSPVVGFWGYK